MNKVVSVNEAVARIEDGMTIMIGGFLTVGTPQKLVDALVAKGVKNLTVIGNDTGYQNDGIGKLISAGMVKKVYASHIGTNKDTGNGMIAGTLEVELVPQGTLAERIRAAGAGLGGILTATGVGTDVEAGKDKIVVDGVEYLLELPLKADVALIQGTVVDTMGNVVYKGTTQNFNPIMATAADLVICEAEELVEAGQIDPSIIKTQGILVDYIVKGDDK